MKVDIEEAIRKIAPAFQAMKLSVRSYRDYFMDKNQIGVNVDYAIIRFLKACLESGKVAFKLNEQDENHFANATFIPRKRQIFLHFRSRLEDHWHNLVDQVDVDIYLPMDEIDRLFAFKQKFAETEKV